MSHATILRRVALLGAAWGLLLVATAAAQQPYGMSYPSYPPVVAGPYRPAPRIYGYAAYPYPYVYAPYAYGYAYGPYRTYRLVARFGCPVAVPASPWLPRGAYHYSYYGYAPYGYVPPPMLLPGGGIPAPSDPTRSVPPPPSTTQPVQPQPALEPVPASPNEPTTREF